MDEENLGALGSMVSQARGAMPQVDPRNEWLAFGAGLGGPSKGGALSTRVASGMDGMLKQRNLSAEIEKTYLPVFMRALMPQTLGRSLVEPLTGRTIATDTTWAEEKEEARKAREMSARLALLDRQDARETRSADQRLRDSERRAETERRDAERREENTRRDRERAGDRTQQIELAASLRAPPTPRSVHAVRIIDPENPNRMIMVDANDPRNVIGEAPSDAKSGNLSPTMQKELVEADDITGASMSAMSQLRQALALNDKAYAGPLAGLRAETVAGVKSLVGADPSTEANATIEMENIVLNQALSSLKAIFGGAPTEGERKILVDIQASVNKTPEQRAVILARAHALAERRLEFNRNRAKAIRNGTYLTRGAEDFTANEDFTRDFDITKPAVGKFDNPQSPALRAAIEALPEPDRSRAIAALSAQLNTATPKPSAVTPPPKPGRRFTRVD